MSTDSAYDLSTVRRATGGLPERPDTNVLGLASLVWRHRWLLVVVTAVGAAVGVLSGRLVETKYTASALLVLDPHEARVLNMKAVAQEFAGDAPSIETQVEVLTSRMLAERVIGDLGLAADPELRGTSASGGEWAGHVGGKLAGLAEQLSPWVTSFAGERDAGTPRAAPSPATARVDPAAAASEVVLEAFQKNLRILQQGDSYVIKVSFTSSDPAKAARIANRVSDQFVAYQVESKSAVTRTASDWLARRIAELRQELQVSAEAEQAFRAQNGLFVANGVDVPDQELAQVAQSGVAARAEAAERAAKVAMVERLQARDGRIAAIPEVINSPLILALRAQETDLLREKAELQATYGDKHPRLQLINQQLAMIGEKTRREIDRIVDNLRIEAQASAERQASIERDMQRIETAMTTKRQAEVHLAELRREGDATRQIYEQLLQRYKETREQQELIEPDVKVLSVAEPPQRPSSPGSVFFGAIGFTASALLTSLFVLVREIADTTLRGAGDVERHLGVPCLGLVPVLRGKARRGRAHRWLLLRPRSSYASAVQSLAAVLRSGPTPPRVLLVTSSLPEEGKTTLAVSLAVCVAQTGARVLLVDGDLRHPGVHREFGLRPRLGIVEFVRGEAGLEDAAVREQAAGLDVLPVAGIAANPGTLVDGPDFPERLRRLRERYDLVVVDSAPVLGMPESRLLAAMADQVVLAVRWGSTGRNTAKHTVRELADAGARLAGAVLTRVDVKRHARDGYGDATLSYTKYGRYYSS
jgi:succinoglycan biosynthesis transport protein ExoP